MRKFIIGLGSFPYKKELENVLPRASTLGFDFVDTSDDYFLSLIHISGLYWK